MIAKQRCDKGSKREREAAQHVRNQLNIDGIEIDLSMAIIETV